MESKNKRNTKSPEGDCKYYRFFERDPLSQTNIVRFRCGFPNCAKTFNRKDYVERHWNNHCERRFSCDVCNVKFARSDLLEKHFRSKSHLKRRRTIPLNQTQMQTQKQTTESPQVPDINVHQHVKQEIPFQVNNQLTSIVAPDMIHTDPVMNFTFDNIMNNNDMTNNYSWLLGIDMFPNDGIHQQDISINDIDYDHQSQLLSQSMDFDQSIQDGNFYHDNSQQQHQQQKQTLDQLFEREHDTSPTMSPTMSSTISSAWSSAWSSARSFTSGTSTEGDRSIRDPTLLASKCTVDEITRMKIINAFPATLQSDPDIESIFSSYQLSIYLEYYWNQFDTIYPIIHFATFNSTTTDACLLAAMIIIGMSNYPNPKIYRKSLNIHDEMRNRLLTVISECPKSELSVLQSIMILCHFSLYLGSQHQFDMQQVFHGTVMTLIRISGYLNSLTRPILRNCFTDCNLTAQEVQAQWENWVNYESSKRISFFAFIFDSSAALLHNHNMVLNVFEIKLELPCTDSAWYAADGYSFIKNYTSTPKNMYKRVKYNFINEGTGFPLRPKHDDYDVEGGNSSSNSNFNSNASNVMSSTTSNSSPSSYNTSNTTNISKEPFLSSENKVNQNGNKSNHGHYHSHSHVTHGRKRKLNRSNYKKWPSFLFALRRCLQVYVENEKEFCYSCFSQFSRLILLHGLQSLCIDLQKRGVSDLSLGLVLSGGSSLDPTSNKSKLVNELTTRLEKGLMDWRGYFDHHVFLSGSGSEIDGHEISNPNILGFQYPKNTTNNEKTACGENVVHQSINDYAGELMYWTNITTYQVGLVSLHVDFLSIQRFVGTTSIIGDKIYETDRENSKQKIVKWTQTINSSKALFESAKLFSFALNHQDLIGKIGHLPFSLYLCCLTIWSFEVFKEYKIPELQVSSDNESIGDDSGNGILKDNDNTNNNIHHRIRKPSHHKLSLSNDKYYIRNGKTTELDYIAASTDATSYINLLLSDNHLKHCESLNGDLNKLNDELSKTSQNSGSYPISVADLKHRHDLLVGLVAYTLYLLKQSPWENLKNPIDVLERILYSYK